MASWEPYARREAALAEVERSLKAHGPNAERLLARADLLAGLGRGEAAKAAYLDLLRLQPDHRLGLNHFGALAHGLGFSSAARTLYAEAARRHPDDPMSNANLANSLVEVGDSDGARAAFEAALAADPDYGPAHQGLARLAGERGDREAAERHLSAAFAHGAVIDQPYSGQGAPIRLLLLISGIQGDIPLRHVLDPAQFQVTALAPAFFAEDAPLPPHDLVFNTIGDADLCAEALAAAAQLTARTDRPVLNAPARVLQTGRVDNGRWLGELPGVRVAASVACAQAEAVAAGPEWLSAHGLRYPLAARSPGYHTGRHFERIDGPEGLGPALADLPGQGVILMNFLDTRGSDGLYRKARAMFVGGEIYPLHLAVSRHWKVHYFTADMVDRPDHRAEDAAFLADMPGVIGERAMQALAAVRDRLGLDYGGVDFAATADGDLVVFEANATMVVYPPPPEPIWDYRRAPVDRVLAAVRTMIQARAAAALGAGHRHGTIG